MAGSTLKYEIFSSINSPGQYEVHNQSGSTMIGYESYVIKGSREKCEAFLKKWNK